MGHPEVLGWVEGVRSFASANDTPPYPTMKLSERVDPVLWLSTHLSDDEAVAKMGHPVLEGVTPRQT